MRSIFSWGCVELVAGQVGAQDLSEAAELEDEESSRAPDAGPCLRIARPPPHVVRRPTTTSCPVQLGVGVERRVADAVCVLAEHLTGSA
jgi:hypothetical protein